MSLDKKPMLSDKVSLQDFKDFYWYREELVDFCKFKGIDTTGGKEQITKNIELYLSTGEKVKKQKQSGGVINYGKLTVETIITADYRNTERHREFFKSIIGPHFKFNVPMMNWCKENIGKTLGDAINFWVEEEDRKRNGHKNPVGKQFKWNQYIRDFFSDPANKDKTKQDCTDGWNKRKETRGTHSYNPLEKY